MPLNFEKDKVLEEASHQLAVYHLDSLCVLMVVSLAVKIGVLFD